MPFLLQGGGIFSHYHYYPHPASPVYEEGAYEKADYDCNPYNWEKEKEIYFLLLIMRFISWDLLLIPHFWKMLYR